MIFGSAMSALGMGCAMGGRDRPRKGEVYRIEEAFTGLVLTTWSAPFTGGNERLLPVGLRFEILDDPPPHAKGVGAQPQPYSEWETRLVDASDRNADNYGGYYLAITFEQLDRYCIQER
jgi:hypothetical protein